MYFGFINQIPYMGLVDLSGGGRHIQDYGQQEYYHSSAVPRDVDVAQFEFDSGVDEYQLYAALYTHVVDGPDIPLMQPAFAGITIGGWVYSSNDSEHSTGIWSIYNPTGLYNGTCLCVATMRVVEPKFFGWYIRQTAYGGAQGPCVFVDFPIEINEWHFIVTRWQSGEQNVYIDGEVYTDVYGREPPTSWHQVTDATMRYQVGPAWQGSGNIKFLDGRMSNLFLSGYYLDDGILDSIYRRTRGLYGV
jgi:hypothetical protein